MRPRLLFLCILALCAPRGGGGQAVKTAPVLQPATVLMCGTVPALDVLYVQNSGGEIVGVLQALLTRLQAALCPSSFGYLYACQAYHDVRLQLWQFLGARVCGFPAPAWNGTANVRAMTPAQALEFLLTQCVATYTGDLAGAVRDAAEQFMTLSSSTRADVSAVLAENAAKAGVSTEANGTVSAALYPPIVPTLAPVPTNGTREPAVMTAAPPATLSEYVPSNPALFTAGVFAPYRPQQAAGPFPDVASDPDATAQFPDKLAAALLKSTSGLAIYERLYLAHPSPLAHFQSEYCASAAWDDDACFPRVPPAVGVTHDAYGNRLLTDRGQAVPPDTADAAGVVPAGGVVPPGAFTAPIPYAAS